MRFTAIQEKCEKSEEVALNNQQNSDEKFRSNFFLTSMEYNVYSVPSGKWPGCGHKNDFDGDKEHFALSLVIGKEWDFMVPRSTGKGTDKETKDNLFIKLPDGEFASTDDSYLRIEKFSAISTTTTGEEAVPPITGCDQLYLEVVISTRTIICSRLMVKTFLIREPASQYQLYVFDCTYFARKQNLAVLSNETLYKLGHVIVAEYSNGLINFSSIRGVHKDNLELDLTKKKPVLNIKHNVNGYNSLLGNLAVTINKF